MLELVKVGPWKRRRALNEDVLFTNYLHKYANYYNQVISEILHETIPTNFTHFLQVAKKSFHVWYSINQ